MTEDPSREDGLWAVSEWRGGRYHPVLEIGGKQIPLTPVRATAYATALLAAASDAEYDAAVMAQMTDLGLDDDAAGALINATRKVRPIRKAAGITFTGGVSLFNRRAFISMHKGVEGIAQFGPAAARRHALHVMEATIGAELDTAYRRELAKTGVDEEKIGVVVMKLGEYREDWEVQ